MAEMIKNVVIVAAKRSAIGMFGKSLSSVSLRDLGTQVLTATLKNANVSSEDIDQVVLGNVLSAGHGQNVSRQISLDSNIPKLTPTMLINQVCGSGLKSVILAAQSIQLGESDIVVAGGIESMSKAPYILPKERWGARMGHAEVIDTMIYDGLWDPFGNYHMGQTAENVAQKWNISRKEQDEFAFQSQKKAAQAQEDSAFKEEIVPITMPQRKGDPVIFDYDEYIRKDVTMESLEKLRPAFIKEGTVTAGNSSGINDGATIIIVASEQYAQSHNLPILAHIKAYNTIGLEPAIMGYGPADSIQAMVDRYKLNLSDVDRFEINEAFAAQSLAVIKGLSLDKGKVNKQGGAIALGHPIGASGARILCTLLYGMKADNEKSGIASLCAGGGMGVSIYITRD